jgi:hypothetical protein
MQRWHDAMIHILDDGVERAVSSPPQEDEIKRSIVVSRRY